MNRRYFDKAHENLLDSCGEVMNEFNDYVGTIKDDIDILINDIQKGYIVDSEEIKDILIDIRDRIKV